MVDQWRTGTKIGRTVYRNDELVGVMDSSELAEIVVEAVTFLATVQSIALRVATDGQL